MECLDGALKTCFIKEMNLKLSPQICFDHENVVSCDDFFVDEFLDLSNEEEFVEEEEDKASVSGQKLQQINSVSLKDDFSSLPTSELSVPEDDLEDLEWLSHFVEDSFSQFSTPFPVGVSKPQSNDKTSPVNGAVKPPEYFKTPVPVKARSKRTRTGGRVWCFHSPSITESSSGSTTSSSSSSPLLFTSGIKPAKKPRKRFLEEKARNCGVQPPRRCSHCGVQKTPQWRTGPHGAKTLCNACGVRFKSGRLLPEYRPACSPTFSSELHSNHHRKVLEMRRSKEPAAEFLILGKVREK